jgi:hypothetical protein
MPYTLTLSLVRAATWSNKRKTYTVAITKTYADKSEIYELREVYEGTARHTAIARFRALQKERPGIEIVEDTARRSWER